MDDIKLKLQDGHIAEAITNLISRAKGTAFEQDLIILSARHATHQREKRIGLITTDEAQVQENRIVHAVLQVTDLLQQEEPVAAFAGAPAASKKKILFCESNPLPQNLFSNIEYRELEEVVDQLSARLCLAPAFALTLEGWVQAVNRHRPQIAHMTLFSTDKELYFHGSTDEEHVKVGNQLFRTFFGMPEHQVECLFFNTWVAEALARELSANLQLVIGFNGIINSYGAIDFATGFYTALGNGKDYRTALEVGWRLFSGGRHKADAGKFYAYSGGEAVKMEQE